MSPHLSLRRPANCYGRLCTSTLCHFLLSIVRNGEPRVLSTQMVHFRRGLLVYSGLGESPATLTAILDSIFRADARVV